MGTRNVHPIHPICVHPIHRRHQSSDSRFCQVCDSAIDMRHRHRLPQAVTHARTHASARAHTHNKYKIDMRHRHRLPQAVTHARTHASARAHTHNKYKIDMRHRHRLPSIVTHAHPRTVAQNALSTHKRTHTRWPNTHFFEFFHEQARRLENIFSIDEEGSRVA